MQETAGTHLESGACRRDGDVRSDLAKLWLLEVFIIAGAFYANMQQSKAALCTATGTNPTTRVQGCFTGSLAHTVLPWLVGGALLVGAFALIGTLIHALRR